MVTLTPECWMCDAPTKVYVSSGRIKPFCSRACSAKWKRLIGKATPVCYCKSCDTPFKRRPPTRGNDYCTRECGTRHVHKIRMASRPRVRRMSKVVTCSRCGEQFLSKNRKVSCCCRDVSRRSIVQCKSCGTCFMALRASLRKYCTKCGERMQKGGFADRARRRGVKVDYSITPDSVFDRDGWKCQLCGKKVHKSKGDNDPDEATVDHKIPLSAGGEHVMGNLQCLCRWCNCVG